MKLLGSFALAAFCISQMAPTEEAFAASSKKMNTRSSDRAGVLVAMDGSGSLGLSSASRKNYLGLRFFPYSIVSVESRTGNQTVETPSSTLTTVPRELEFSANLGQWTLRPEFDLSNQGLSFVSVGYFLNSQLEVGGVIALERATAEDQNKTKTVTSQWLIGPQAVYYMSLSGFGLEASGRLYLISGSRESTADNRTTTGADVFGFGFETGARLTSELNDSIDYTGGITLSYQSTTDEADKNNEKKLTNLEFSIIPAGVRFKF
ncbi:MAG: hypothetical protein RJB13_2436 [Pseudomonadota bacterium]